MTLMIKKNPIWKNRIFLPDQLFLDNYRIPVPFSEIPYSPFKMSQSNQPAPQFIRGIG